MRLGGKEVRQTGRTITVGSRATRPSTKPLRVMSLSRSSPVAFVIPYVFSGRSFDESDTTAPSVAPNTAMVEVNTTRMPQFRARHACSRL